MFTNLFSFRWCFCRRWQLIILCVLIVSMFHTNHLIEAQQDILFMEDFESGGSDWMLSNGWTTLEIEGNHVLSGQGHTWAEPPAQARFMDSFRLQFRIMPLAGRIHLNYKMNESGRYFIGFESTGSNINKQYWEGDFLHDLAGADGFFEANFWHHVDIFGNSDTVVFSVDGVSIWSYTDPEPLELPASFAFETLDDGYFYIDDIVVYAVDEDGPVLEGGSKLPEGEPRFTLPTGNNTLSNESGWVRTGGPLGGLGYDIRMNPQNPDLMYVTDAWAGVHISYDGGHTWMPANDGITVRTGQSGDAIPIFCLTIDPNNPDTLWAGTDQIRGIFKSVDAGQTWSKMDSGVVEAFGITFRGLTVDPKDSNTVYAAAELASWTWNGQELPGREFDRTAGVVYRTTNGGESWSAIWRGDNLARYVWVDPRDSDVLYLSTGIFDREAGNSDPAVGIPGGEGVLKSTDGGTSWTPINDGIHNLYVGTLFMHPTDPDTLLAGTHNNSYYEGNGVYLTEDAGQTWQHVLDFAEYRGEIESVEFSLSDPNIAYAGGSEAFYRSEDGGYTWMLMSGGDESGWGPEGVRAGFPIDFQVDPRNPNRIFANNYGGGNFLSEDGGETWTVASEGYTGAQTRGIAVDPTDSGRVYAAARSGIFFSANGGGNWIGLNYPPAAVLEWYAVAIDPSDPMHMLAANNWQGTILDSHSGGARWRPVANRIADNTAFRTFAFAPSDPNIVYAGISAFHSAGTLDDEIPGGGIWLSRDGGITWESANDNLSADANVIDLAVTYDDPSVVYAATGNYDLLKSNDGGISWQRMNLGLSQSPIALSVATHPTDSQIVFAGLRHTGVIRTSDGGNTWQMSSAGLNPEAIVSDIVFDPTRPDVIYLSDCLSGVYRSVDGGVTWQALNTGLRMRDVNALAISSDGIYLYAATEGEGVFRLYTPGM